MIEPRTQEALGNFPQAYSHIGLIRTARNLSNALATVREAGAPLYSDTSDLFERWETQVAEREIAGDCSHAEDGPLGQDAFAEEFDLREEEEALREELRSLRAAPPAAAGARRYHAAGG